MKKSLLTICAIASALITRAQPGVPVVVEAESGTLGSSWTQTTDADITYISTSYTAQTSIANYPESGNNVVTYTITFPQAGTYNLYVLLKATSSSNDSFHYGNVFGDDRNVVDGSNWVSTNNLYVTSVATSGFVGYTDASEFVVDKGSSTGRGQVYKWIKLSGLNYLENGVTFTVPEGSLTQKFQIGGREAALQIDKLVFGSSNYKYSVDNLNKGAAGTLLTLPINLLSFTGKADVNGNVLTWQTASENNNDFFEILRSIDGSTYHSIGQVKARESLEQTKNYHFTDNSSFPSTTYYKLKQVDLDGNSSLFGPLAVKGLKSKDALNVFASENGVIVSFDSDKNQQVALSLFDTSGKKLKSQNLLAVSGKNVYELPLQLSPGVYILNINSEIKKFIK